MWAGPHLLSRERDVGMQFFVVQPVEVPATSRPPAEIAGGTESTITVDGEDWKLLDFTDSADCEVLSSGLLDVCIVPGGGGSGGGNNSRGGGGGGGGGVLVLRDLYVEAGVYPALIGAGGAGTDFGTASRGSSSSIFGIEVLGGGGGGGAGGNGGYGSTGGGAGAGTSSSYPRGLPGGILPVGSFPDLDGSPLEGLAFALGWNGGRATEGGSNAGGRRRRSWRSRRPCQRLSRRRRGHRSPRQFRRRRGIFRRRWRWRFGLQQRRKRRRRRSRGRRQRRHIRR